MVRRAPGGFGWDAGIRATGAEPRRCSAQESSGHATLARTQIYTHVSVERHKATYAQANPRA
ncbi:hypothetical protein B4N89_08130 [Embleya scabrispora]|uniref:Tyr recombinase domain-containing protein n=1 Tax=Embleya scabrispora TaxID=159449 RepID=A0A1T3NVN0_9ACTN|nr:hypothetical protein B4N89_08130 [Embleya scabrispora]